MWHFISERISEELNFDFICDDIREVANGDTHRAYKISDGRKRFFVKINTPEALPNFEAEAQGLEHLSHAGQMRIPKYICHGKAGENSFLVLEHITLSDGNQDSWYELGSGLAKIHKNEFQEMYGWQEDNFIGRTPQSNKWAKNWSQFFAEQRIGFLLMLLEEKGTKLVDIDQAVSAVASLLQGHNPKASMLHGDLWQGNVGFHQQHPVIFDPAFYFGDRETDLAMTELFSKFPNSFYQGYNNEWPIEQDYQYRKPVYQLYHLLNHALMFGGQYVQSAQSTLRHLDS